MYFWFHWLVIGDQHTVFGVCLCLKHPAFAFAYGFSHWNLNTGTCFICILKLYTCIQIGFTFLSLSLSVCSNALNASLISAGCVWEVCHHSGWYCRLSYSFFIFLSFLLLFSSLQAELLRRNDNSFCKPKNRQQWWWWREGGLRYCVSVHVLNFCSFLNERKLC